MIDITKEQALNFLMTEPYKFGHMLGFTKLTELHNRWIIDMLTGSDDRTLQAHRLSYKTTCVSITLSLLVFLLPDIKTMFMRKTDDDVKEVVKQVQKILKDPHTKYLVKAIYGENVNITMNIESSKEIDTNLSTGTRGTVQLLGIGTQSSITGKHFDRIFTDDIVNISDRISKAERDRTKTIYQELQNIKNENGRIYNTGTPWHKDDCFMIMPEPEKHDCYSTGLILPDRLKALKDSMTPSLFAANYELRHIASEDVIFFEPMQGGDQSLIQNGIAHLDSAFYGEDYTAFTIAKEYGGKVYMLGKMWRKHVEDCYQEIVDLYNQFLCGKLYTELNADKGMVARDLKKMGIKTVPYNEGMNKYIKIATYLKAIWKNVVFVEGTDPEYIAQICDYTENADHDDAPDSAACIARILYPKLGKRST